MLVISDKNRNLIFGMGIAMFAVGVAVLYWASPPRFDQLPNYQRIAVVIPFLCSYPLLLVDSYRSWSSVHGIRRFVAMCALIGPPVLLLGCIVWFLAAPNVRG